MRSTFSTHPVKHDRAVRESGTVLSDYCIWSIRRRLYLRTDFPVSLGGYNTDMLVAAKAPHWRSAAITPCLAIWLMRLTQLAALHRQKLINLGGQQFAGGIGAAMALNPHRAKKRLMAPLVADSSHGMAVLQRKNNGRPPGHQSCPASWRIMYDKSVTQHPRWYAFPLRRIYIPHRNPPILLFTPPILPRRLTKTAQPLRGAKGSP